MTDEEKIEAVTAKLLGKVYVGQRVRIKDAYGPTPNLGPDRQTVISEVNAIAPYGTHYNRSPEYVLLDPSPIGKSAFSDSWHIGWLELV